MNTECNPKYFKLCEKTERILTMLQFVNYAYNTPDSEINTPMSNDEKIGGQFVLFHIMDELKTLDTDIVELLKNK